MNTPKLKKSTIEAIKTVTIAVLVTALVAFIGGVKYANKQQAQIDQAVKKAQTATAETPPLK